MGGPGGAYGGLFLYVPEAGLGSGYSDPEDQYDVLARLLDRCEAKLGEPLVMGALVEHKREEPDADMFGQAVVDKPKPVRRRRTRASDTAEQEGWY
jgi:hypothetical protein